MLRCFLKSPLGISGFLYMLSKCTGQYLHGYSYMLTRCTAIKDNVLTVSLVAMIQPRGLVQPFRTISLWLVIQSYRLSRRAPSRTMSSYNVATVMNRPNAFESSEAQLLCTTVQPSASTSVVS